MPGMDVKVYLVEPCKDLQLFCDFDFKCKMYFYTRKK